MVEPRPSIRPQRLKALLHRLMDIYSPSGKEREIGDFLRGYLRRRGLPMSVQPVDEHRFNLVVMPPETEAELAFIGHLDTVAAYDLEDFGFSEQDDVIRGLGAADMKGGCAAMVEAFTALWESGRHRFPVALCLVVGEEEDGDGARSLVKNHHFPWAIIGEPTDLGACLSCYGYLGVQISTAGKRMHASLAGKKQNAIESMLDVMLRISRYMEARRPELIYNIRDLFSAPAGFVVPERCEAWIDVHLPPDAPIGQIVTELEETAVQGDDDPAGGKIAHRNVTIDAGYALPEKGMLVDVIKSVFSGRSLTWNPQSFRSHSDANQLWAAGIKPVVLGPGRLEMAHVPDESVSFDQVCLAAELYLEIMMKLSGECQ